MTKLEKLKVAADAAASAYEAAADAADAAASAADAAKAAFYAELNKQKENSND